MAEETTKTIPQSLAHSLWKISHQQRQKTILDINDFFKIIIILREEILFNIKQKPRHFVLFKDWKSLNWKKEILGLHLISQKGLRVNYMLFRYYILNIKAIACQFHFQEHIPAFNTINWGTHTNLVFRKDKLPGQDQLSQKIDLLYRP